MSEIKQINTGVAELLAVKVPEGATGYTVIGGKIIFDLRHGLNNKRFDLPSGNWTPLGLDTELTEEQYAELVDSIIDGASNSHHRIYKDYRENYPSSKEKFRFLTAKEAFASLMKANGVYCKNPYGIAPPRHEDILAFSSMHEFDLATEQWQQAEANTGPHLILKPRSL